MPLNLSRTLYPKPAKIQRWRGVEAIFTVLALRDQIAPATLNLENPDPAGAGLDFVRGAARPMAMEHAISNGFGFGGVNASVIFRKWWRVSYVRRLFPTLV